MRFDLGTLDSGEQSLPFGLLVSGSSFGFSNVLDFNGKKMDMLISVFQVQSFPG